MLKPIELTPAESKKLIKACELYLNQEHQVCNFPEVRGSDTFSLSDLAEKIEDYNQEPVVLTKVKSILFKPDTGLVNNSMLLFNPIVVSELENVVTVTSGRHRISALLTICEYYRIDPQWVEVPCVVVNYNTPRELAKATVAFNTNRTMTATERERVNLSAKLNGETASPYNAAGNTKSIRDAKSFFKQLGTQSLMDVDNSLTLFCTTQAQSVLLGKVWEVLLEQPEFKLSNLKSGFSQDWVNLERVVLTISEYGVFDKFEGNLQRNKEELERRVNLVRDMFGGDNTDEDQDSIPQVEEDVDEGGEAAF